ncbi:ABC transporter substrate-binding protein [Mesorhizobium sp. SB112]|uniref:ABC transporter substrate-binding protein n=1 Tax=Mesorhizobium sp. SB112 TaxID=3151853 RepID=UPI003263D7EB
MITPAISSLRNTVFRAFTGSALAVAVTFAALPAQAQTKVIFGPSGGLSDNSLAVQVAIDEGYYKEAGIDAEVVAFKGGGPALQALTSGAVQFCVCAPEHVIRMRSKGINLVVAYALNDRVPYVLLSAPDGGVSKLSDLKGKKVGITTPGSLTDNLVRLALKREGIDADRNVEIVTLGAGAAHKAGIDTGNVAAGMLAGFDALSMTESGYVPVVDWRQESVPALGLLATQEWLDENPDTAKAIAVATQRATKLLLSDREVRVNALKKLFPEISDELIQKGSDNLEKALNPTGHFDEQPFRTLEADLLELEPDLTPVDFAAANPRLAP